MLAGSGEGYDRTVDERVVALLRERLPDLRAVWLFGSRARGDAMADSDWDLALLGRDTLDGLTLLDALHEVETFCGGSVDLVDLRRASDVLAVQVLDEGQLIWAASEVEAELFLLHAWSDHLDFLEGEAMRERTMGPGWGPGHRRAG